MGERGSRCRAIAPRCSEKPPHIPGGSIVSGLLSLFSPPPPVCRCCRKIAHFLYFFCRGGGAVSAAKALAFLLVCSCGARQISSILDYSVSKVVSD